MQQNIARSIVIGIIVTGPASASTPRKSGAAPEHPRGFAALVLR